MALKITDKKPVDFFPLKGHLVDFFVKSRDLVITTILSMLWLSALSSPRIIHFFTTLWTHIFQSANLRPTTMSCYSCFWSPGIIKNCICCRFCVLRKWTRRTFALCLVLTFAKRWLCFKVLVWLRKACWTKKSGRHFIEHCKNMTFRADWSPN